MSGGTSRRGFVVAVVAGGAAAVGAAAVGAAAVGAGVGAGVGVGGPTIASAQERPSVRDEVRPRPRGAAHRPSEPAEAGPRVTANEDLMREHGAIGRLLVAWSEAADRLRSGGHVDVDALSQSVLTMQRLAHDYHERTEEEHVFPLLERAGRERELVATLRAQHEVARATTRELASMLAVPGGVTRGARSPLAARLDAFVRMYHAHASREDTIVLPIFRELAGDGYATLAETFETEEHERLGEAGLEGVLDEIRGVERALGISDLARFTPR